MLEFLVTALYIFTLLLGLVYLTLIIHYWRAWNKIPFWGVPSNWMPQTHISIIIPARNEAANIQDCLQSVIAQNFPSALYEVIVVDDFSEDKTDEIVRNFIKAHPNHTIQLLRLSDFKAERNNHAFKKTAIEIAMKKASGQLIITTDADCVVSSDWLRSIVSFYEFHNYKMIAAPVNFHQETNLLSQFQSLDFMGMMLVTGAGIQSNWQKMCNGANLTYEKKAFNAVNGFEGTHQYASGDDMFLMQKFDKAFPSCIGFLKNRVATVRTLPKYTWNSFIQQRIRWATKNNAYDDWKIMTILGAVFFFCILILGSLFLSFFFPQVFFPLFIVSFLVKAIIDFFFLKKAAKFFYRSDLMRHYLFLQMIHIIYIVYIGTVANFKKKYRWKGRTVE